jgi:hypothetical protein
MFHEKPRVKKSRDTVFLNMYSPYCNNTKNRVKKLNTILKINPKKQTFYLSLSVLYTDFFDQHMVHLKMVLKEPKLNVCFTVMNKLSLIQLIRVFVLAILMRI